MKVRNTFIIFLVSGFWHGANWTFIVWGGVNALYFLPLLLLNRNRTNLGVAAEGRIFPSMKELFQMGTTFLLTVLAWVFFRSLNLSNALEFLGKIITLSKYGMPNFEGKVLAIYTLALLGFQIILEWQGKAYLHPLQIPMTKFKRRLLEFILVTLLLLNLSTVESEFIYFQF